jgi:hypothetical protein
MARRYTYACTLSFGQDGEPGYTEIEVEVSYSVSPGCPEQGPSYDSGGQPGEDPMVEDIRLEKVEGEARPWAMGWGNITDDEFATDCIENIEGSDRHLEAMLNEASEEEADREDAARESQYEARREMAREPDSTGDPW